MKVRDTQEKTDLVFHLLLPSYNTRPTERTNSPAPSLPLLLVALLHSLYESAPHPPGAPTLTPLSEALPRPEKTALASFRAALCHAVSLEILHRMNAPLLPCHPVLSSPPDSVISDDVTSPEDSSSPSAPAVAATSATPNRKHWRHAL